MNNHIENIGEYLKKHEIKPSYQRIKIFQYLEDNKNHPTVDMIYKALCPQIPTLSKTTVYNTLNLFIEKKIVNIIVIEENETRYDSIVSVHGHFKCDKCGKIYDIDIDERALGKDFLDTYDIKEQHYYFKGTCEECLKKMK
ncbi:Transcriptional regulator PerR [Fusobacterium sp. DD29]|uniref:Fur family transcriptional regulator n=1 Tax=unclassified Fusobacterium TaxID=2648384 RepID=UPI001B8AB9B0|nr:MULTISPECIES: Fur family transcriptional regulator [unclassified Fusobacterium]MBR8701403.1 Transcriptional regulator PerR [Fusobacterium sp. DD45]MBR8711211.1 Transcriptional regulator PerR [Fusobacterium sp. DD28]MBR8750196.1 Transcriptional regulator PerR [Fusobacterium sp. DD29]MBR8751738.1 Transcriptional regulator PerR [Fusobacterium sp. DD26]MBR8762446.1 Transcriptional regulator PerR [Fusobacterium sp. DD25]